MTDPQRLLDAPPDPTVLGLLGSADHDEPSPEAISQTAVALGIAGLVSVSAAGSGSLASASSLASGSGASGATTHAVALGSSATQTAATGVAVAGKVTALLSAKWLILGAAMALGGAGAVAIVQGGNNDARPDPASLNGGSQTIALDNPKTEHTTGDPGPAPIELAELAAVSPSAEEIEREEAETRAATPPPERTQRAKKRARSSSNRPARRPTPRDVVSKLPAKSIAEEIAILDRARRQLAGGDGRGALRSLDELGPAGASALGPEVSVLRIRALAKTGQKRAAARQARKFLLHHPDSPHARELQAIASGKR